MAIKFRRVKRRRKARKNPSGGLLMWGLAGAGILFLAKKMKDASAKAAALNAAKVPLLTQRIAPAPEAGSPAVVSALSGGIFGGTRGFGSL